MAAGAVIRGCVGKKKKKKKCMYSVLTGAGIDVEVKKFKMYQDGPPFSKVNFNVAPPAQFSSSLTFSLSAFSSCFRIHLHIIVLFSKLFPPSLSPIISSGHHGQQFSPSACHNAQPDGSKTATFKYIDLER